MVTLRFHVQSSSEHVDGRKDVTMWPEGDKGESDCLSGFLNLSNPPEEFKLGKTFEVTFTEVKT